MSKNISIIIDTSALNLSKPKYENFFYFKTRKILFQIINFINTNKELEHIKILIPKMVVEELKKHQLEAYEDSINLLTEETKKFRDFPDFVFQTPNLDYRSHLEQKINAYQDKYNIGIIDFPKEKSFKKLIDRAINKEKPFNKRGDSDSGFKDAIIWESILEYANKHKNEKIIFWKNDDDFLDKKLDEEFSNNSKSEIIHFKTPAEIKSFLAEEYKLQQKYMDVLSNIDDDFFNYLKELFTQKYKHINHAITGLMLDIIEIDINRIISNITYDNKENMYYLEIPSVLVHKTPYYGMSYAYDDLIEETDWIEINLIAKVHYKEGSVALMDVETELEIIVP